MNLLAVDTATDELSVALSSGDETWFFAADAGLRHSDLVTDIIDLLMKKAALKPEQLSGVVCAGGPGSFTGLRIGFSVAKGLALSLGIPFAAIPTLDCMARPFSSWPGIIIPAIDAKRGSFFCALFRGGTRLCPDMDASPAEIFRAGSREKKGIGDRGSGIRDRSSKYSDPSGLYPDSPNKDPQSLVPSPQSLIPILLVGPGARLLYEKMVTLENFQHADITLGNNLRWGDARTLLEIAKETNIIEKNNSDYFSGPEYIRKSDAEEHNK